MYTGFLVLVPGLATAALQLLPPVNLTLDNEAGLGLSLNGISTTVYITSSLASHRDSGGLTLIPPTGQEFAQVFIDDLNEVSGKRWTLEVIEVPPVPASGILLNFSDDLATLSYENGEFTEEGYVLEIAGGRAVISGSGSRGMWWGTRTLLQQMILSNWTTVPALRITDAPAYETRGFMLDAGRKWYAPSFLKELCTYASFFKLSEFHYHTSDNYPLNRGHNDTWSQVYSQFSLRPESIDLQGLIQRPNETLTRADYEDLQQHCARRGITIVPEIEAPGHCLSITKWKPELALTPKDLLNLTHPDSIPTVKRIWEEFLPWFQTKEVHIGADEYDSTLADDYITFVNDMSSFINETTGKKIRIWGTYEPSRDLAISKNVVIQHWQYGQSDPVQLQADGYDVINTEDWWAYMSLKNDHMPILPAPYPQFFNEVRVLNFAGRAGWQWQPALFNPINITEQLPEGAKGNKGAILAAWNDNGPDASTQLEAYYAIRRGIPLVAARAWSGSHGPSVWVETLDPSIEFLSSHAPGQNLNRQLVTAQPSPAGELVSWTRGNATGGNAVRLGYRSKGMNYTLSLSVTGPFTLWSDDVMLTLSEDGVLAFNSDGYEYPLRSVSKEDGYDSGLPGRIWANATSSSHEQVTVSTPAEITITGDVIGGSRAWINGLFAGRFEVFVFGGKNTIFSWSQMAFVAPLDGLNGGIQRLVLKDGVQPPPPAQEGVPGAGGPATGGSVLTSMAMAKAFTCLWAGLVATALL
ncbi:glycoside hydrolase family 20 protein [Xylariaceae sp. FL1651]|nr:glycoside hydrolase family 20 protein [Xylariaceae sp. FL1651]